MMRCKEIEEWTFSELVGAFLDLAITYLLLSASAVEFLFSRFLSLFGLSLPCPCNGLFGDPNGKKCWQRVLSESPPKNVSSVQFFVLQRSPFATVCSRNSDSESYASAVNDPILENDVVGLNGKSPRNSFLEKKSNGIGDGVIERRDVKERRFDFKGKRVRSQKARYHRRLRKGDAESGRSSSASSDGLLPTDVSAPTLSPASAAKMVNKSYEDGGESSLDSVFPGRDSESFISNDPFGENDTTRVHELTEADLQYNVQGEFCFGDDEKNAIRVLEHELEQEHAARTALYLELEKERSAAASAADEAMAMIMRLQEEKASIEMEARQYQRMIEEKSAYDFEEMRILKEIMVRREKEKHFLVKEVEAYRKMIFQNDQLDYDAQDVGTMNGERTSPSFYAGQDSSQSIYQKGRADNTTKFSACDVRSAESQNCTIVFGKELPIPESDEVDFSQQVRIDSQTSIDKLNEHLLSCCVDFSQEFQEKKPVTWHKNPHDLVKEVRRLEPASSLNIGENDKIDASHELQLKMSVTCDQSKTSFAYNSDDSEKHEKNSRSAMADASPCIHGIPAIADEIPVSREGREKESETHSMAAASDIPRTCDDTKILVTKDISRSYSDINRGSPPTGLSRSKFLVSDLRRNSMSVVDFERSKIDDEVGCLRERLRIVQEGREKLHISPGYREKDTVQSQLLDSIVSQLREIRQLTEPRKLVHLASLPLLPTKGVLKKRNWRSVSLAVHGSS